MPHALVIDSNADSRTEIRRLCQRLDYQVDCAENADEARDILLRKLPEILLINLEEDHEAALEMFHFLGESRLDDVVEIYILSRKPSLRYVVEGMRAGASDVMQYPDDLGRLESALRHFAQQMACEAPRENEVHVSARGLLSGESPPMQRLYRIIRKVAPSEMSVMLCGESGTGKELLAQTIHELSGRSHCPFVAVNCGAISPELAESELFGHVKGAFTGANRAHDGFFKQAQGGTLFLDEITEMNPDLQVKLLRVLESETYQPVGSEQSHHSNVRVLTSTNRDPEEAVTDGLLREDLFYRIAQFPVRVPTLRERGDDVITLAKEFLDEQNEKNGVEKQFTDDALELLRLYHWPGNVREMRNLVARLYLMSGEQITSGDIPDSIVSGEPSGPANGTLKVSVGEKLEDVEKRLILATLEHFGNNKSRTADELGISLKTLYNRLKKYRVSA